MNPLIQLKKAVPVFLVALICFGLLPTMQAVSPPPDGGYPEFNTAEGQNALLSLTTGAGNTALGWRSLFADSTGSFNTGVGAGTLILNTADANTAVGAVALLLNTTGTHNTAVGTDAMAHNDTGRSNTAAGAFALFSNTTGAFNVANGVSALSSNTTGASNVANGDSALSFNTTGNDNVANGDSALFSNTTGNDNVANGYGPLFSNTTGNYNVANGYGALYSNTTGSYNVANGYHALFDNTTGSSNTALGPLAGSNLTTGVGNVCIGAGITGVVGANNNTWIKNVYASVASGRAVYVNSDNKIGTLSSSRRYKEEIKPMGKASETLFGLKPVTFRYKKEVDRSQALSFGLIAEEVAEISPDLITCDKEGKPETVRYDAVNAMLLNEFLKEHRKVEALQANIAQQHKDFEAAAADLKGQIQKVSAQLEARKPAPQVVNNP